MTSTVKVINFATSVSANRKKFIGEQLEGHMDSIDASIEDFINKLQLGGIVCITKIYSINYASLTSKTPDRISNTVFTDAGKEFWYSEFAYEILRLLNKKLDDLGLKGFIVRVGGAGNSVPARVGDNIDFWILPM